MFVFGKFWKIDEAGFSVTLRVLLVNVFMELLSVESYMFADSYTLRKNSLFTLSL